MNDQLNSKDLLIGILIGGAIGAATALLLTPKSGKELRQDITNQYASLKDKQLQVQQNVSEQINELRDLLNPPLTEIPATETPFQEVHPDEEAFTTPTPSTEGTTVKPQIEQSNN